SRGRRGCASIEDRAARRSAGRGEPAVRVRFPPSVPARGDAVPHRGPRTARGGAGAPRRLPSRRGRPSRCGDADSPAPVGPGVVQAWTMSRSLVGRDGECTALRGHLATASGQVILVSGEAGAGKTTLVEHALAGVCTATGRADELPGAAYEIMARALRPLAAR